MVPPYAVRSYFSTIALIFMPAGPFLTAREASIRRHFRIQKRSCSRSPFFAPKYFEIIETIQYKLKNRNPLSHVVLVEYVRCSR